MAASGAPAATADTLATRAMVARVVGIPTVKGQGKVPEMAHYLAGEFWRAGWADGDVEVIAYNTGSPDGTANDQTAALIVRWRVTGGASQRPIMVMGHMDVVAAKREDFTKDPSKLAEGDGYFYGRGTVYIKGGVVVVVRAMIELRAGGFRPERDIVVFFTGDKESHGLGAEKGAGEWLPKLGNPEYALNADGIGVRVADDGTPIGATMPTGEKGYADYILTVRNPGGHSGTARPDNAIYSLARALGRIDAHRFAPVMKAGHASNMLPEFATALVNCRLFPQASPDAVRDELEAAVACAEFAVARNDNYPATIMPPLRTDVTAAFTKAVRAVHPGMPVAPTIVTGATDARTFRRIGIPVYAVSAQWLRVPSDMRVDHADERIPVQLLYNGVRHWKIMLGELVGGPIE